MSVLAENIKLSKVQSQFSVGRGNETGQTTVTSQCWQRERDWPDDSHKSVLTEDTELARLQSQVSIGRRSETGQTTVTSQC